jgi:hypothetical protein
MDDMGIEQFSELTPDLCAQYAHETTNRLKKIGTDTKPLSENSIVRFLQSLDVVYGVRHMVLDSLPSFPWADQTARTLAGIIWDDEVELRTAPIPRDIAAAAFKVAHGAVMNADSVIAQQTGVDKFGLPYLDRDGIFLFSCCFFLIGFVSGMRDTELGSLDAGVAYSETHQDGETYCWITGTTSKGPRKATPAVWLVPPIAKTAIDVVTKVTERFRTYCANRVKEIEEQFTTKLPSTWRKKLLAELIQVRQGAKALFLENNTLGEVRCLYNSSANKMLRKLFLPFGHYITVRQLRRTYAVFMAENTMGDLRYLRVQFKHATIRLTSLYAMMPGQDKALYKEIEKAIRESKESRLASWMSNDVALAGGGGVRFTNYRNGQPMKFFPNQAEMIRRLANIVSIRGTGHSWCMSEMDGCGGEGLYEMTRCADCDGAVIDEAHVKVWQGLMAQSRELLDHSDIGPGGLSWAKRNYEKARNVLKRLKVKTRRKPN